jgi:hypothetical protein
MKSAAQTMPLDSSVQKNERAGGSFAYFWLLALVLALMVGLRFINLGADAPIVHPYDIGLYVDEGYKTLSPRNLVNFGQTHWHPDDNYKGWYRASVITQTAFYAAFSSMGESIESARMVSVLWFALFLGLFAVALSGKYPAAVVWLGAAMLGFHHVLWIYSRVALFEVAAVAVLFGGLLILHRYVSRALPMGVAFLIIGLVTSFGIKLNSAYVLLPGLFGIVASHALLNWNERRFVLASIGCVLLCFLPVLMVKAGFVFPISGLTGAIKMVDLFPPNEIVERFLVNSLNRADPFLVILAYACALGFFLHKPHSLAGRPYRSAIIGVALLGTAMLALMPTSPLRYWVLLVPAYILLVVEWFAEERSPAKPAGPVAWPGAFKVASVAMLVMVIFGLIFLAGVAAGQFVPVPQAEGAVIWLMLAGALGAALCIWRWAPWLISPKGLRTTIYGAMIGFVGLNTFRTADYLVNPTWEIRTISSQMRSIVGEDAVMAGDWSPLFAFGSGQRAFYTNSRFNSPDRFELIRPTHFLYCNAEHRGVDDGMRVMKMLEDNERIQLGEPIFKSEYRGRAIILYPLHYTTEEKSR